MSAHGARVVGYFAEAWLAKVVLALRFDDGGGVEADGAVATDEALCGGAFTLRGRCPVSRGLPNVVRDGTRVSVRDCLRCAVDPIVVDCARKDHSAFVAFVVGGADECEHGSVVLRRDSDASVHLKCVVEVLAV